jgi:integrase
MFKITKRFVESLDSNGKDTDYFDDTLQGFGVRVRTSGRKVYFVRHRTRLAQRRVTIGLHGPWTAEAARVEAQRLLGEFAAGNDSAVEKAKEKALATIAELGERFIAHYIPYHLKSSTQGEYTRAINLFITPKIGRLKIIEVLRSDIAIFHHSMRKIPYQANRVIGVLSVMLAQAELWGLRPEGYNPCRGIKKFKEVKRERFLSPLELKKLGEALETIQCKSPYVAHFFRLLVLTGCRLGEIQTLKWDYVNFEASILLLPDSKTGKKTVYLGASAVDELKRIPKVAGNPYVICGSIEGRHLADVQGRWEIVRNLAVIEDVRIHDLRHTFASRAVALGQGLPTIGKLLGHTQTQTTARYAHLASEHSLAAANQVSKNLADALL